jgi:hypothetical protein
VAEQQKHIATNTSQRIIGTRGRRKGEPMSEDLVQGFVTMALIISFVAMILARR